MAGGLGGPENFSNQPSEYQGHGQGRNHAQRYKLDSKCKSYNCMFFTWQFRMQDYKVTIDDKDPITGPTCNFWGVPHREFQMKVPNSKPPKKKPK